MNKTKLLIPSLVMIGCITSCGSSGIKRNVYKESTFDAAMKVHDKIKAAQKKDDTTTLFNNGSINYKYKLDVKATPRVEGISFHDVSLNMSAGCEISWSLDKNYLKIEGEKESLYFVKENDKYWQCESFLLEGKTQKEKSDVTDDVNYYFNGSFKDYIVDRINYYSTLGLPFLFTISSGITGEEYELPAIFQTYFDIAPDTFFDNELHEKLEKISKKYKDANQGNYFTLTYGIDNDSAVCLTTKGKCSVNDFTDPTLAEHGNFTIDNFVSWKDNFMSQYEMKFNINGINVKKINANMTINMYIASETSKDTCKVDTVNPGEYTEK